MPTSYKQQERNVIIISVFVLTFFSPRNVTFHKPNENKSFRSIVDCSLNISEIVCAYFF